MNKTLLSMIIATAGFTGLAANAETIEVNMTVKETDLAIDNSGTKQRMWTYDGTVPGPLVRVREGDVVNFSLKNHPDNENSHSMDFHAARADVLDEFAEIKPGDTKQFTFKAEYPGVFIYHCGADSMAEHIARGMYGVIIVDPQEGYSKDFPEPDREYVLVQGDLFEAGTSAEDMRDNKGWQAALVNGKVFHYSPVHDSNASQFLESEPGERVRIHFVNAMINEAVAFHPIAGIWEQVWDNGNPRNVSWGLQTVEIAPAHGMSLDIISPKGRDSNNAIVDHRMKHALNGAISVLMNYKGADPDKGRGDQLILR